MPSAKPKKVGTRNVLGSPFVPVEACPKLKKILRETLKGVWPPRAPSSKVLIRKDPELLALPSKEERAKRLKELKSRSSFPHHPDRLAVRAGLKSCLRSLPQLSLLLLDKSNPNVHTLSSTLFPLQRPDFRILLLDKLSPLCEEFLGFSCLALGFTQHIVEPSNRFHEMLTYVSSLKDKNKVDDAEPPPKKKLKATPSEKPGFGSSNFIAFGDSEDEGDSPYLSPVILRVPVVHNK